MRTLWKEHGLVRV
jgi:hypothetical protein